MTIQLTSPFGQSPKFMRTLAEYKYKIMKFFTCFQTVTIFFDGKMFFVAILLLTARNIFRIQDHESSKHKMGRNWDPLLL